MKATLHTDGGARGNPGPAGIGYVLRIQDAAETIEIEHGEYIGETTNNQAEYKALLAGLRRAQQEGVHEIECYLDSELVVKQLNKEYRVKHEDMKPLYARVQELEKEFDVISYQHVRREKNKDADRLVNEALDNTK